MKKLTAILVISSFIAAACTNVKEEPTQKENQEQCEQVKKNNKHERYKKMTPEQKANCEAWKNWENQTPEKKSELILAKKEKIEKKIAEMEAREAKMKTKKEEFKAKWANFDNLDIEAQKALIDEFGCCHKKPHYGNKEKHGKQAPCKKE